MFSKYSARQITSLALCFAAVTGQAQQPPEKKEPAANVRFWNMCAPDGPALNLTVARGDKDTPVFPSVRPFYFTGYMPLEPGKTKLLVQDASSKTLAEIEVSPDVDQFYTITATSQPKGVTLSVTDDTYKYSQGAPGKATIYQFVPGATAVVGVPGGKTATLKWGESASFEGLPLSTNLPVTVTGADGKPVRGSFPLEFRDGNRIAGLIILDRYQRIRTRVMYSGFVFALDPVDPFAPAPPPSP